MSGLRFIDLTCANRSRLRVFPGHAADPWSAADWMVAVTGEVGELANKLKKVRRRVTVRNKPVPTREEIAEEIADIVIYLDLLADFLEINMGKAVQEKFNRVSEEIGADIYL